MVQRWIIVQFFIYLWISDSYVFISINVQETTKGIHTFSVPVDGPYEISAGGACGGGTSFGDGGLGGLITGLLNLTKSDILTISIGETGQTKSDTCGTAGGGGATAIFITRGSNTRPGNLIMVAPGGGGAGFYQSASAPDYKELNLATKSDQCIDFSSIEYQAAPGRNINSYYSETNFSYNPAPINSIIITTPTVSNASITKRNLTAGCVGGYGGGGQGGFMLSLNDYKSFSGGGGGGGGYEGGQVLINGVSNGCTAGGPGKPFCILEYCDIAKSNTKCQGSFLIKKHEPYKELLPKDRTNYEKPKNTQNMIQSAHTAIMSLWSLIVSKICIAAYYLCFTT